MFHVALIYTCNMKENALASCISYARSHHVELGMGVTGRKRGVLNCMPMCASARVAPSNIVYL